jgi:nucleoside-diphosphate kinase
MMQLDDAILSEHYSHLEGKPFYNRVKQSMMSSPVIVLCLEGLDVTNIVRKLIGITNGRDAAPGTIRGDFSVSAQENIVHASDSAESAETELKRFFSDSEIFMYNKIVEPFLYDLEDPIVKGK